MILLKRSKYTDKICLYRNNGSNKKKRIKLKLIFLSIYFLFSINRNAEGLVLSARCLNYIFLKLFEKVKHMCLIQYKNTGE